MISARGKRWVRVLAGLVVAPGLATLLAGWRFRVWSYGDYRAYQEVQRYQIGDDLWYGRIHAGQDAEAFTAEHPPHHAIRADRFVWMRYFEVWPTPPNAVQMEWASVIAKDGRLIHASVGWCTGRRVFFTMTPEDEEEYGRALDRYWKDKGL